MWRPSLETLGAWVPAMLLAVAYVALDYLTAYTPAECPS